MNPWLDIWFCIIWHIESGKGISECPLSDEVKSCHKRYIWGKGMISILKENQLSMCVAEIKLGLWLLQEDKWFGLVRKLIWEQKLSTHVLKVSAQKQSIHTEPHDGSVGIFSEHHLSNPNLQKMENRFVLRCDWSAFIPDNLNSKEKRLLQYTGLWRATVKYSKIW